MLRDALVVGAGFPCVRLGGPIGTIWCISGRGEQQRQGPAVLMRPEPFSGCLPLPSSGAVFEGVWSHNGCDGSLPGGRERCGLKALGAQTGSWITLLCKCCSLQLDM